MDYFFYILKHDSGFAPNPFYGFCTLATCKPKIRKTAKKGDWIIGLGSENMNCRGHLIYAMKVTEKISYDEYWGNLKFKNKKYSNKSSKSKCGDNIYHKNSAGNWIQEKNQYHIDKEIKKHDTQTNAVLISSHFFYFGKEHFKVPNYLFKKLSNLTQGHRYKGLEPEGKKIAELLEKKYIKNKLYGMPIEYKDTKTKLCA